MTQPKYNLDNRRGTNDRHDTKKTYPARARTLYDRSAERDPDRLDDIAYAQAQSAEVTLSIPAQNLGSALTQLADQSGIRLILSSQIVTGKRSPALNGSYTPRSAFAALLSGSGLSYRFTNANTITVYATSDSAAVDLPEGTLLLDTITVSGGFDKTPSYQQPGSVNYINEDDISRFRGSNAADMLRGTPGVVSGDARNSGNGLDVNMRGMQGMDQVEVIVDGAANNVTLYQGYQGISNRSFVDPDFIAGAEIHKGGAAGSRAASKCRRWKRVTSSKMAKTGADGSNSRSAAIHRRRTQETRLAMILPIASPSDPAPQGPQKSVQTTQPWTGLRL